MAACVNCGRKMRFFDGHLCASCIVIEENEEKTNDVEVILSDEEIQLRSDAIDAIMLTTETAPNLKITKRIEIVTAECAFGMNVFKDLFAGVRDIVGGRSKAVQQTMRDSRKTALYELKREAHFVGANAVVGVDLDYVELSAAGSMVMLVASGTAVIIEEESE